ncbi:GSCFA domain-containing protein [Phaeobacter sp.]|uniref:GSCFA domain-containing protein n=1 Tax=Phaeobacter sp. TaxID=1902409 RepID=UPI0025F5B743|nr:GSCFA domain-containing protein [Phaeobacter sp.]
MTHRNLIEHDSPPSDGSRTRLVEFTGRGWISNHEADWDLPDARPLITPRSHVFTIGSCFARSVAAHLSKRGVKCEFSDALGLHYNPGTILREMRLAAGEQMSGHLWTLERRGQRRFVDPYRNKVWSSDETEIREMQDKIVARNKTRFALADVFIVTLGLSEICEERIGEQWSIVNRVPVRGLVGTHDFRSRVLPTSEVVSLIGGIIATIRSAKSAETAILFTVSPVPLKTSLQPRDPRVSNALSKARLLSGLHECLEALGDPYCHYFPSFEYFNGPNQPKMFLPDGRHVRDAAVDGVMHHFLAAYCAPELSAPGAEGLKS